MRVRVMTIEFVIPIQGVWASPETHQISSTKLLDHYLSPDTLDDEAQAAAILVKADGVPWNTTEHSESLYHIEGWLSALSNLLSGSTSEFIWAFEESSMMADRKDDLLVLVDKCSFRPFLPPVCFKLKNFAFKLAKETCIAVKLVQGMKEVVKKKYPNYWQLIEQDQKEQQPGQHIDRTAIERDRLRAKFREEEKNIVQEFLSVCGGEQKISDAEYRVGELYDIVEYLVEENMTASWNSLASKVGLSN